MRAWRMDEGGGFLLSAFFLTAMCTFFSRIVVLEVKVTVWSVELLIVIISL